MTKEEFCKALREDLGEEACEEFSIPVIDMFSPLYQIARCYNVFCEDVSDLPKDFVYPGRVVFLTDEDYPSRCILVKFCNFLTNFTFRDDDVDNIRIGVCPIDILDDYYDFVYTSEYHRLSEKFKKESD